jgi:hypothetical protein
MIRFLALALFLGTAANAAEPPVAAGPSAPTVYGLTEAEKAQVLESASRRPDADNPALLPALPQDRRVHGEVGAMIGTGGARGVYGIVGVPLGETGSATFAFSDQRLPTFYGYGPFGRRGFTAGASFGAGLNRPAW